VQDISSNGLEDGDFDEEEMLQRGMELRAENLKRARYQLFSDESSSGRERRLPACFSDWEDYMQMTAAVTTKMRRSRAFRLRSGHFS
jgi:hypothetical protein